jgi:hypothetical protein
MSSTSTWTDRDGNSITAGGNQIWGRTKTSAEYKAKREEEKEQDAKARQQGNDPRNPLGLRPSGVPGHKW